MFAFFQKMKWLMRKTYTVVPPHGNLSQWHHFKSWLCNFKHHVWNFYIPTVPEEVDIWVVAVFCPPGVASGEGAEEGVGEQTCHLLLRHGDGVARAFLEERYRLEEVQQRKVKMICFCQFAKRDVEVCCINVLIWRHSVLLESAIIINNQRPAL